MQVTKYIASPDVGARALLQQLTGITAGAHACVVAFGEELYLIARMLVPRPGCAGISRFTVRELFFAYLETDAQHDMLLQHQHVRAMTGLKLGIDSTYSSGNTLSASTPLARTASGRCKQVALHASVLSITAESGLVLAACLTPNDCHDNVVAAMCGLYGAEMPPCLADNRCAMSVCEQTRMGGSPSVHPLVICTDCSHKDKNIWKRMQQSVGQACLAQGIPVYVPCAPDGACPAMCPAVNMHTRRGSVKCLRFDMAACRIVQKCAISHTVMQAQRPRPETTLRPWSYNVKVACRMSSASAAELSLQTYSMTLSRWCS
jgi:hypothetical protein